jgi:hypothetical protein
VAVGEIGMDIRDEILDCSLVVPVCDTGLDIPYFYLVLRASESSLVGQKSDKSNMTAMEQLELAIRLIPYLVCRKISRFDIKSNPDHKSVVHLLYFHCIHLYINKFMFDTGCSVNNHGQI